MEPNLLKYEDTVLTFYTGFQDRTVSVSPFGVQYVEDCVNISAHVLEPRPCARFPHIVQIKIRDPRYAKDLREELGMAPWTEETDRSFHTYLKEAHEDVEQGHVQRDKSSTGFFGYLECQLNHIMAYRQAQDALAHHAAYVQVQNPNGIVPMYFGTGCLDIAGGPGRKTFEVFGTFTEYIEGVTADTLCRNLPRTKWRPAILGILSTVRQVLRDTDWLRHEAISARHIILSYDGLGGGLGSRIIMNNFNGCVLRGVEGQEEWDRIKATTEEIHDVFDQLLSQVDGENVCYGQLRWRGSYAMIHEENEHACAVYQQN